MLKAKVIGRLAPSPTGYMHLGNAWAFLLNWLAVRKYQGKLILRIDDIDPARSKMFYSSAIKRDLEWLGLDWDEEAPYQSQRMEAYQDAINLLQSQKLVYPCFCTRKELKMLASAPHQEEAIYPGICAALPPVKAEAFISSGKRFSLRVSITDKPITFSDLVYGEQKFLQNQIGDFPLMRSDGVISYQLATVVDDAFFEVNLIVRGRDLLSSTPRQIILQKYLSRETPRYAHIPLLLDSDGERLAKRHGSLSIKTLRENGISAEQIVGKLAQMAGINTFGVPLKAAELLHSFNWAVLPRQDQKIINF